MIIHQPTSTVRRFGLPGLPSLAGDALAAALGRRLDDGHHYLRRVVLAGVAPLHAVVVGRGGTFAVTPTNERGRFRHRNGHWYTWNRGTESWVPWAAERVDEARMGARRLQLQLERAGLPADVRAVLYAGRDVIIEWDADERPGVLVEQDPAALAAVIARDDVLTPAQVDRIVALLDPRQRLPRVAASAPG